MPNLIKFEIWKCQSSGKKSAFQWGSSISTALTIFAAFFIWCNMQRWYFAGNELSGDNFRRNVAKWGVGGNCGNVAKPHFYPPHIPPTPAIPTSPQLPLYRKFPEFPRKIESPHKMLLEMPELFHNIQTREYLVSSLTDILACFEKRKQRRFVQR